MFTMMNRLHLKQIPKKKKKKKKKKNHREIETETDCRKSNTEIHCVKPQVKM